MTVLTTAEAKRVLEVVDAGLCSGLGRPEPGSMCVEAAVSYALGLPHGDNPPCVGEAVRSFKIVLNDASWSSNATRAEGMRAIAVCQLGSNQIDQVEFAKKLSLETIRQILPLALRGIGLEAEALACEKAEDLSAAESAAWSAESAAWSAAESAARDAAESAWSAESAAWSAAESAARDAAESAAWSAESAAWSAESAAWSARSAAWSAESAALDGILTIAAKVGVSALRHCLCLGVELWDQINDA